MTYGDLLEILAAAALTVDPDATYRHGRINDVSLASVTSNTNLIYVLHTMQASPDTDGIFERWRMRIGFFRQDSTSSEPMEENQEQSNEESRQVIFGETLILARKFYSALLNEDALQFAGTPQYTQLTRELQGTFSGWGLDIEFLVEIGCEFETTIPDAVYQNADESFEQSIKRGETYTAPDITVIDSDGSTFEHPANKDVTCTPSASPATAVLKNTEGTTISTTSIDPGTSEDITAPDGGYLLKDTDGTQIGSGSIPSDTTGDITAPNAVANLRNSANTLIGINNLRSGTTYNIIAPDATAVLKNSAGTTITTNPIPSNVSEDMTAPDATAVVKNTLGATLLTESIPSNVSEDVTAPNGTAVVKDQNNNTLGTDNAIPSGGSKDVSVTVPQIVELFFAFEAGDDTSALATNSGTTWTLTSLAQDGSSGTITVSDNGAAYGAFSNPTTITNGETIQVKRTSAASAGSVTITGTYA